MYRARLRASGGRRAARLVTAASLAALLGWSGAVAAVAAPESTGVGLAQTPVGIDEMATLIKTTDLSTLSSPIIDPTGITYSSHNGRLLIADSEIDEEPGVFSGVNLFDVTRAGALVHTGLTHDAANKREPTGLAYNPSNQHVFVTNDTTDAVTEFSPGADGIYGTSDDVVSVPDMSPLGLADLEDVAYDTNQGRLYLLDAADQMVYGISPGSNGVFDGVPPAGDDGFSVVDLPAIGILDATGLAYRALSDTLLLTDAGDDALYEISKTGTFIRKVDISFLKVAGVPLTPSDLVLAPASDGSGVTHIYVVDRGSDNGNPGDAIPPPMDGKLYELFAPLDNGTFDDDGGSIFEADIEWLAAQGITKGCNPPANNLFCPDDPVTRAQMAAFLVRALDLTAGAGANIFVDDDGSIFETDIDKLATAGVTRGCNPPLNNKYCPAQSVTRAQMAAFLVRALGYTFAGDGDLFIDDDGSIFESDIDKLATAGVTKGCNPPLNNKYCPNDLVTRGQMAAFLHRALG